jgi:hypothetical protein
MYQVLKRRCRVVLTLLSNRVCPQAGRRDSIEGELAGDVVLRVLCLPMPGENPVRKFPGTKVFVRSYRNQCAAWITLRLRKKENSVGQKSPTSLPQMPDATE